MEMAMDEMTKRQMPVAFIEPRVLEGLTFGGSGCFDISAPRWAADKGLTAPLYSGEQIDALTAERDALVARVNDLPWHVQDIQRGLILFRTSNNAHGSINFESLTSKVDALPLEAKQELADVMRSLAESICPRAARGPVLWQWRSRIRGGAWDAWERGRYPGPVAPFMDIEERPLYAHPAPTCTAQP